MIDPVEAKGWFEAGKTALEAIKTAWDMLPKGENKDSLEKRIDEAGQSLHIAKVKLAREFEYNLCQCQFPPEIMLWKQKAEDICL